MTITKNVAARTAAVAAALALALPLSGCFAAGIPGPDTDTDGVIVDPAPTPEPDETTEPDEGGEADSGATSLTFEAGDDLDPTAYIEWADGLYVRDDWEIVAPDEGQGTWTYGSQAHQCSVQYWQGTLDGIVGPGEDIKGSDAVIAWAQGLDVAIITPIARDSSFSYQVGGNSDVEARAAMFEQDGTDILVTARAFSTPGVGLLERISCFNGVTASTDMADQLREMNGVVVR